MKTLPLYISEYERLHRNFVQYIRGLGYSSKNKSGTPHFVYHIREFLFFLEQKGVTQIKDVSASEIIGYHHYLKERPNQRRGGGLADTTITGHLLGLRIFFDYLLDMEIVDASPARLPKFNLGKGKPRPIITIGEVPLIFNACISKREKALIALAYGCGLRRSEIHALNTTDIVLHKGLLIVRDGKGGKSRTIPLSDTVIRYLKEYVIYERPIYFHGGKTSPAFLVNNSGNRMKPDDINEHAKAIIKRTENNDLIRRGITLHCFRHSITTHLLDNGATIEFVQSFLGHKNMDTSHYYARRRKQQTAVLKYFG